MGDNDKPYIVGERGPEHHVPDRDGHILSRDQSWEALKSSLVADADELITEVFDPLIDRDRKVARAAVKFVKGSDSRIEGLAIPFDGPFRGKDLDGEDFGPDTDFAFDWFPQGRPVLYHHGLDSTVKTAVQGRQVEHEVTDEGVWVQAQLDTSAKYHAAVSKLIGARKLFFSSGSVPHLVEADRSGHIKRWPWTELSLTPTPSNLYAGVHSVKSADLITHLTDAGLPVPAELIASALKALDATTSDDDALPDGAKFADLIDRLSVDGPAWVKARRDWYAKSGRVLSVATRERIAAHPNALRQLADDLDELLTSADAPKDGKSLDFLALYLETERTLARLPEGAS